MSDIYYDPAAMNTLYDDLGSSVSTLNSEMEQLVGYAGQFHNALQGDNANQSFDTVFNRWKTDYDDSLQNLADLRNQVDAALGRALQADSAVGQGFEVF